MSNLCVIISSIYVETKSDSVQNEQNNPSVIDLNQEITTDSKTVQKTLSDSHTVVELNVKADISNKEKKDEFKSVYKTFQPVLNDCKKGIYKQCHIVINTHGATGVHDINDSIIKQIISDLSVHKVKITQISALQCNALKVNTIDEQRETDPYTPWHKKIHDKKSAMAILQSKLNKLKTTQIQSFNIRGFENAYDPNKDKEQVISLLKGESSKTLLVKTILDNREEKVNNAIKTLEELYENANGATVKIPQEIHNILSGELARLQKNLGKCDKKSKNEMATCLTPRTNAFFNFFQQTPSFKASMNEPFNHRQFYLQYRKWTKDHRGDKKLALYQYIQEHGSMKEETFETEKKAPQLK